jgi:hypothetical protein
MTKIDFSKIRRACYIKLGVGGCWENLCIKEGSLRLGYWEVPHIEKLDKDAIRSVYLAQSKQTASNHARQVLEFCTSGLETLWITFSNGFLWWSQADTNVEFFGHDKIKWPDGSRLKHTLNGWHCKSISGKNLRISELSGKLTRSAGYRQTICEIKSDAFNYLLNKIQDQVLPEVKEALAIKEKMLQSILKLIRLLTWKDFELFIDLLLVRNGGQRVHILGGVQKNIDIELIFPLIEERALVQVKAATNQQELNKYIENLSPMSPERIFYVYHSCNGTLKSNGRIILVGPDQLSELALKAGLLEWLVSNAG